MVPTMMDTMPATMRILNMISCAKHSKKILVGTPDTQKANYLKRIFAMLTEMLNGRLRRDLNVFYPI